MVLFADKTHAINIELYELHTIVLYLQHNEVEISLKDGKIYVFKQEDSQRFYDDAVERFSSYMNTA